MGEIERSICQRPGHNDIASGGVLSGSSGCQTRGQRPSNNHDSRDCIRSDVWDGASISRAENFEIKCKILRK